MAGHSRPKDGVASARLCPGHPRLSCCNDVKTWMPGTSPGMTKLERSRVAAVFAKQVQLLLHRTIRETEHHRIFVGLVGDPLPARHHEQVARTPLESLLADPRTTLAFDRGEYRGVGRTIARGLEALRQ